MTYRMKKSYFYSILGTIIITMLFASFVFLFYVKNIMNNEYCEKAKNVGKQYISNSQVVLDNVLKCANGFEIKSQTAQEIYNALSYICMCNLDISNAIYVDDTNLYSSGRDYVFSNYMNMDKAMSLKGKAKDKWMLYEFEYLGTNETRLVYVITLTDTTSLIISSFPSVLISQDNIIENNYYLSDSGIVLNSDGKVYIIKDNGKINNTEFINGDIKNRMLFLSYELSDEIDLNLYVKIKTTGFLVKWIVLMFIFLLIFVVIALYETNKLSSNISGRVLSLSQKMKSYIVRKGEDK